MRFSRLAFALGPARQLSLALFIGIAFLILGQYTVAQSERNWTDNSGLHSTKGKFIRIENDAVLIINEAGQLIPIPLARLSEKDQEFVANQKIGTSPMKLPAQIEQTKRSMVVIEIESARGKMLCQGYVFSAKDNIGYVAVFQGQRRSSGNGNAKLMAKNISINMIWYEGDVEHKVPLECIAVQQEAFGWIFTGPADKMPQPMKIARKFDEIRDPTLSIVGYNTTVDKKTGLSTIKPRFETVAVQKRLIGDDGKVRGLLLKRGSDEQIYDQLAVTENGDVVGIASIHEWQSVVENNLALVRPFGELLAEIQRPDFDTVYAVVDYGDSKKLKIKFYTNLHDPFERIKSSRLLIRRETRFVGFIEPNNPNNPTSRNFVGKDLGMEYKNPKLKDAVQVELTKGMPPDYGIEQLKKKFKEQEMPTFSKRATHTSELEIQHPGPKSEFAFEIQQVYESTDGTVRRFPTQFVKLPGSPRDR